jgi:hypothetical protein
MDSKELAPTKQDSLARDYAIKEYLPSILSLMVLLWYGSSIIQVSIDHIYSRWWTNIRFEAVMQLSDSLTYVSLRLYLLVCRWEAHHEFQDNNSRWLRRPLHMTIFGNRSFLTWNVLY